MRLSDFDYQLPNELIAQRPKRPRDHSRLLVLNPETNKIEHRFFYQIGDYLQSGDVLVLNNTKVMSARLIGKKQPTGGKLEVFLLKKIKGDIWQCLVGGKGGSVGLHVVFRLGLEAKIISNNQDGTWQVQFNQVSKKLMETIDQIGLVPLPPYIKRNNSVKSNQIDKLGYQTVYADNKKLGSVAAPTAGLHFSPALIQKLIAKGVRFEYITLHVGLGTFAAVKTEKITDHKMHSEWAEADKGTIARIMQAKKTGNKIIAVGTTSARTLESIFRNGQPKKAEQYNAWTNIFIYPGYKFKIVDELITNFHVPKSTLLMLVSALAGESYKDKKIGINIIKKAYEAAVDQRYRFLSYGDAMYIKKL